MSAIAEAVLWMLCPLLFVIHVAGIPPPIHEGIFENDTFTTKDMKNMIEDHVPRRVKRESGGFQLLWVTQCGYGDVKPQNGLAIEVAITDAVAEATLIKAARLIFLMTRFMPREIFEKLARYTSIGVYAANETAGAFPEFQHTLDRPECKDICYGACSTTCTADGRKYSELLGLGGRRAVVREDNLLCLRSNPYRDRFNVLTHEIAHTIHSFALTYQDVIKLQRSYISGKGAWETNSYAVSNWKEYFAEATTTFFGTSQLSKSSSGGMNYCSDKFPYRCEGEAPSRMRLKTGDEALYNFTNYVYSSDRDYLIGRILTCDW